MPPPSLLPERAKVAEFYSAAQRDYPAATVADFSTAVLIEMAEQVRCGTSLPGEAARRSSAFHSIGVSRTGVPSTLMRRASQSTCSPRHVSSWAGVTDKVSPSAEGSAIPTTWAIAGNISLP